MKQVKGFTLIESLIALAISGILLSAAVPSFQDLWAKHQSRIVVTELAGLINFARIHSVSEGQYVALCPYQNETTCGSDWSTGVMVFVDPDKNGKLKEGDKILRVLSHFPEDIQLKWGSFGGKKSLRFGPSGTTFLGNGTFTYCPADNDARYANQIIINYTGRLRFAEDNNDDGVKENSKGDNLSCGV